MTRMNRLRPLLVGAAAAAALAMALGPAAHAQRQTAPTFEVDRLWPKPLPNHWILGSVTGIAIDSRDHIFIVHRGLDSLTGRTEAGTGTNPPTAEDCCSPAPGVLEFDAAGALVANWGAPGQGYEWPVSPGGIAVDGKGNVWIAAAGVPEPVTPAPRPARAGGAAGGTRAGGAATGAGAAAGGGGAAAQGGGRAAGGGGQRGGGAATPPRPEDAHILKFSARGQFLLQIGKAGQVGDANSETSLNHPADIAVDDAANEVYVADGGTSQRIVVFDATTGAHKRHWAGHGSAFGRLSCVTLSADGMVYVCDRQNNRVQVFKKDGTFVKEAFVSKTTGGFGAVWDLALSRDPRQQFAFVADGMDEKVFVLDRDSLNVLSSFGDGGRWPGTFRALAGIATDSKGNLYTAESYEGKRVQRFVKK